LRLPKFDIDTSVMLGEQLKTLGMPMAFSDNADFSGITSDEPLQIAEVVHQANVTVDEKGTIAAAATAVIARTTSAVISEPKRLDVDRPFLFFLRDRQTGALLFSGQVTNPAHS
jgi:serpin B